MKVFKSNFKNFAYFFYRIIKPVFDPIVFFVGVYGYCWFVVDIVKFKMKDKSAKIFGLNLFPILDEKISFTQFDAHYFYQEPWAFEHILKMKPNSHVDVGSTYKMSGYLSKIVKTIFVDIRPIDTKSKNLEIVNGSILNLPFEDNSVESLSCLHVAEHIGLGRYGDEIDPDGTKKACKELSRVLATGGFLYFSLPIGKERLCFNAHRVHSPKTILEYFSNLKLVSFSATDDNGEFFENVDYGNYEQLNYGCGMFLFSKDKNV